MCCLTPLCVYGGCSSLVEDVVLCALFLTYSVLVVSQSSLDDILACLPQVNELARMSEQEISEYRKQLNGIKVSSCLP